MPTHPTGLKIHDKTYRQHAYPNSALPTTEHYSAQGRLSALIQWASVLDERVALILPTELLRVSPLSARNRRNVIDSRVYSSQRSPSAQLDDVGFELLRRSERPTVVVHENHS
jgi:hypothetical protein